MTIVDISLKYTKRVIFVILSIIKIDILSQININCLSIYAVGERINFC